MNVILIAAFFLLFRIIFIFNFKTDTVRIERNCKNIIRGLYSLTDDIQVYSTPAESSFQILIRLLEMAVKGPPFAFRLSMDINWRR